MNDQKIKQISKYDIQYGVLCARLGDLEAQKLFLDLEISGLKKQIIKLNELASQKMQSDTSTNQGQNE